MVRLSLLFLVVPLLMQMANSKAVSTYCCCRHGDEDAKKWISCVRVVLVLGGRRKINCAMRLEKWCANFGANFRRQGIDTSAEIIPFVISFYLRSSREVKEYGV